MFSALDHAHMARALRLAARGLDTTHPNPRVGCVVARGEHVVGEGWHERAGGPHAEVVALGQAGEAARGATTYVTLEPCAHHGRTPPCAEALVAAGVSRVVAAVVDPFPAVAGRGLARLAAAGIAVESGLLASEAEALNVGFLARHRRGRPWVRVKLAGSLDGRTALPDGESRWISSEASRADVQRWRARASCLLTGIGTVLADDPRLDLRIRHERAPTRYVMDTRARLPENARLRGRGPVVLLHGAQTPAPAWCAGANVETVPVATQGARLDPAAVLALLARRRENEVHVEAGARLCGALLAAGLVDELVLYLAPHVLGAGRGLFDLPPLASMGERITFVLDRVDRIGPDLRILCSPESSRPSAA